MSTHDAMRESLIEMVGPSAGSIRFFDTDDGVLVVVDDILEALGYRRGANIRQWQFRYPEIFSDRYTVDIGDGEGPAVAITLRQLRHLLVRSRLVNTDRFREQMSNSLFARLSSAS